MRLIIILLFVSSPLIAQVTISNKTAQYFLEVDDSLQTLKKIDSVNLVRLHEADEKTRIAQQINKTYQNDSVTYVTKIATLQEEVTFNKEETKAAKKEVRKQKTQKIVSWIGGAVIIILIIL